ncbi:hypothetical protein GCM10025867_12460 [Frondihabitans sucicola]|uniref:PH domain-containing protein n=1 Tax=Frondihabitans sucicola TaxID=1268041 RepID=A0ABM8GKU5_9MICO|nr:hypothetical protein [Frondihabitans sucicola]BDZ49005.1 hypothetical protein GCM10025867_12460 [Frondihabitans sucicola]
MARSEETRAAWLAALAEMEAVAGASGDGTWAPSAWSPDPDLGPLPPELAERAREVQAKQKSAIARVLGARRTVIKHIAALKSVPPAKDTDRAVYLDAAG